MTATRDEVDQEVDNPVATALSRTVTRPSDDTLGTMKTFTKVPQRGPERPPVGTLEQAAPIGCRMA